MKLYAKGQEFHVLIAHAKQTTKEVCIVRSKVEQLQEKIDLILPALLNLNPGVAVLESSSSADDAFDMSIFPLNSMDDVDDLEQFFTTNPNSKKVLAEQLSHVGGNGCGETCRRLLRKVLTDGVAQLFSYHGLKKKRSFNMLQLKDVLFDAIRRNKSVICTDKEIETAFQDWLRFAKFRLEKKKT